MTTWNYRILKKTLKEDIYYQVIEVYYNDDNSIYAWTPLNCSAILNEETPEELIKTLDIIKKDITNYPILEEVEVNGKNTLIEEDIWKAPIKKGEDMILKNHMDDYLSQVDNESMVMSLETSHLLQELCIENNGPVLDLGSGFSSFVCRLFSPKNSVISVDTNYAYLMKTKAFCDKYDLDDRNFLLWETFLEKQYGGINLIFFDIGYSGNRSTFFRPIFRRYLKPGVKILIDDIHKTTIKTNLQIVLNDFSYKKHEGIKEKTLDSYGRYSWLIEGV